MQSHNINHLQTERERSELCINRPLANKCNNYIFLHVSQCFTTVKAILGQKSALTRHTFVLHGLYVSRMHDSRYEQYIGHVFK